VAGTFADVPSAGEADGDEDDVEEEEGGEVLAWGQQRHTAVGRFNHAPMAPQPPANTPPTPPLNPALPPSLRAALLRPLTAGLAVAMTASELLATLRGLGALAVQWKDLDSVTTQAVVAAVSGRHSSDSDSDDPPQDSVAMTVAAARLRRAAGILGAPDDTWTLDPTPSHAASTAAHADALSSPAHPSSTTSVDSSGVSSSTSSTRSGPRSHGPAPLVPTFASLPQLRDQFPRLPLAALPAVLWTCHRQGHAARYATRSLRRFSLAFVL